MTDGRARPIALSLKRVRLCLDCDCLTDQLTCPWCDRDATVPLAGWFRPIEDRKGDAARHEKAGAAGAPQWILIVQQHQRDLYRVLRQALARTGVEVLYERRVGQRRRAALGPGAEERRGTDRRRPRPSAAVFQGSPSPAKTGIPPRPSVDREPERVLRPRRRQTAPV
ncbi:MAG TPA: hypothetical protein VIE44_02300 [Methylomirabilota bacterium]|jgi:hypothetical protein